MILQTEAVHIFLPAAQLCRHQCAVICHVRPSPLRFSRPVRCLRGVSSVILREMFGNERLTATLNQNADSAPEDLIHSVHDAVDRFADGSPQFDDTTMLCLKYHGTRAPEE